MPPSDEDVFAAKIRLFWFLGQILLVTVAIGTIFLVGGIVALVAHFS